jgi:glutathione S-transferase
MRARMALISADIPIEIREVELKNKPAQMLSASPKGTVPVLVLKSGNIIDESFDIMMWACKENDPQDFLNVKTQELMAVIALNDNHYKKALDRYKYPNRYPEEDCSGARSQCQDTFCELDEMISKNGGQLLGPKISIADLAVFPFIRQGANVDRAWFDSLPYKSLQAWLDGHLESSLFQSSMQKYEPWQHGDDPVFLGMKS